MTAAGASAIAHLVTAWSPTLEPNQASAIVSVLLYVARSESLDVTPVAARLFDFDPTIEVDIHELGRLRGIIARHLAAELSGPDGLTSALRVHAAIDDLVAAVVSRQLSRMEQVALVDSLTGVGNRRAMDRELAAAVAHATRHERRLAVAMIDLDGLKQVNDSEGHATGDETLRSMGAALAANARSGDSVYRIGGDEFLVLARDSSPEDVERLLVRVRESAPAFSAGVASVPADATDAAALLHAADARLYAGRGNRVVLVPSASASRAPRSASLGRRGRGGVGLVAGSALAAEMVRRRTGVDVRDSDLVMWSAALAVTPLVGTVGWRLGSNLPAFGATATATFASLMLLLPMLDVDVTPKPGRTASPPTTADVEPTPGSDQPAPSDAVAPPTVVATPTADPSVGSDDALASARSSAAADRPGADRSVTLPVGDAGAAPPALPTITPTADPEPVVPREDELEAADASAHDRRLGRADPHEPGTRGDPHDVGATGDPHADAPPGRRVRSS